MIAKWFLFNPAAMREDKDTSELGHLSDLASLILSFLSSKMGLKYLFLKGIEDIKQCIQHI